MYKTLSQSGSIQYSEALAWEEREMAIQKRVELRVRRDRETERGTKERNV